LTCINYERPNISCAGFTELVRLYPILSSFQRNILFERQTAVPQSQRLIYNNIPVWKVQITEFIVQVLNNWINSEKFGRTLIFIYCGIINEIKKLDNELQSFQG
jgi:hypothetical protein